MDALLLDLRYALRRLRQQRAFTLSVVLVLALGIGAATAMFSAVDAALLRPLPFQRDDRLVTLENVHLRYAESTREKSAPDLADVQAMRDVFTHAAAYAHGGLNLTEVSAAQRLRVGVVTGVISRSKNPFSWFATARSCERSPHSSISSRETPSASTTFSAVSPIAMYTSGRPVGGVHLP